jgi:hypothetical protein
MIDFKDCFISDTYDLLNLKEDYEDLLLLLWDDEDYFLIDYDYNLTGAFITLNYFIIWWFYYSLTI